MIRTPRVYTSGGASDGRPGRWESGALDTAGGGVYGARIRERRSLTMGDMTMTMGLAWTNAAVAFALELAALAVLAWGGWRLGGDGVLRIGLAVALPVAAALLWALVAAPHATYPSTAGRLVVQAAVFGGAAAVLAEAAAPRWAAGFLVLVVANLVLAAVLPQVAAAAS